MATSGFSFSNALNAKQATAASKTANTTSGSSSQSISSSTFSSVSRSESSSAPVAKAGFSFGNALSAKQTESASAISAESTNTEPTAHGAPSAADILNAKSWQRGDVQLKCIEKWHETHDVVSFRFQGLTPVKFNFKPGQFLTFKLEIDGQPVYRSYTIASSPSRPYSLTVTVKQIDAGLVSNYLAKQLNVGDVVTVTGPDGAFNLVDIKADKYLFLSAGSGVTPMHSMSRWLCDTHVNSDIAFVHSARSGNDVIFADAMASMAQRNELMSLSYVFESDANRQKIIDKYPQTQHETGRLDSAKLATLVPDYQSRTVFVCGPEPYMVAVKTMLETSGFNMDNFYQESFGSAPKTSLSISSNPNSSSPNSSIETAAGFMLSIADTQIAMGENDTLLVGIESKGLPIIAACRSGVCGACKCQVTKGKVSTTSTATLSRDEIDAGFVLACSTTLQSDVSLKM